MESDFFFQIILNNPLFKQKEDLKKTNMFFK